MPTVILLDVSLSMCRQLAINDASEGENSIKNVAIRGLTAFIDAVYSRCKMEFTSVVIYSSLWEKVLPFTRDTEALKAALYSLETYYDKTNLLNALSGVQEVVLDEWGSNCPLVNVILVTDGLTCLSQIEFESHRTQVKQFMFPCTLHVVTISPPSDSSNIESSLSFYESLIESFGLTGSHGQGVHNSKPASTSSKINANGTRKDFKSQIHVTDSSSLVSICNTFVKIAEANYNVYKGRLFCGNLWSLVSLFPPLEACSRTCDFDNFVVEPSSDIKIIGFMSISEVSSPPVLSRHLMFSLPMNREQANSLHSIQSIDAVNMDTNEAADLNESPNAEEEGRQPSLCVLLHGSLKVEASVAICVIGCKWYGMLYSWADSKKKFNLMLSTFYPGTNVIPWLGPSMDNLGNANVCKALPANEIECKKGKKSYHSQNTVVWIRNSSIQSDIQKIIRLGKRLPEKMSNFYKELSRFRKAAASFGFYDLMAALATFLELEINLLPSSANQEAKMHLTYAVTVLRSTTAYDVDIPPFSRQNLPA